MDQTMVASENVLTQAGSSACEQTVTIYFDITPSCGLFKLALELLNASLMDVVEFAL